ncbi:MAG: hypothetical protein LW817_02440 [Candidatus Caenarcaniphilales bacterium]|jgi:thiamine biosynthesis lipoprotein ApbE|nr:hypothetical protein [Candidatus Caenarcaniphilales bacterium]
MRLFSLLVLAAIATMTPASAYFRCNTVKCQKMRLEDKQTRLEAKKKTASDASEKANIQEEIDEVLSEVNRIDSKTESTASRK